MKVHTACLFLFSCLILLAPLTVGSAKAQALTAITEKDIEAMLTGAESAARKRNVAGVIASFAPDIKIKVSVLNPGSNKEQEATLTKEQFAFNARQNMRRTRSYQLERKNTRIKIYDPETAMVSYELYETFKLREGTMRTSSSEVLYVSLRKGKLVITEIETRMRVY
jgi:hypothetical protein